MENSYRDASTPQRNDNPTSFIAVSQPKYDPCFTRNLRIINDLLYDEKRYHSTPGYCTRQPPARIIWMRRTLLNWLREAKELTVCISLQWDLTCITPVDFIAPVVDFLEFVPNLRQIIRQAALCIYIKTFHVEDLSTYMPSYTAAACILYALNLTVHPDLSDVALRSVTRVQHLLKLEARKLREVYQTLQICFEPGTVELSKSVREGDMGPIDSPSREVTNPQQSSLYQPTSNTTNYLSSGVTTQSYTSDTFDQSLLASTDVSSTSTGLVSNSSFDRNYAPVASNSACSTSSPPSETELLSANDIDNERPQSTHCSGPPRHSINIPHSHTVAQTNNHPNGKAAGQNINEQELIQSSIWKNAVAGLVGPLSNATDLALKAVLYPTDPRLLLLATAGLPSETERRWTPTDIREVLLD